MGQGGKRLGLKGLVHAWSHLLPPPQDGSLLVLSPPPWFPGPCLTSPLLPLLSDYCPLCPWQGLGHRHGEGQDQASIAPQNLQATHSETFPVWAGRATCSVVPWWGRNFHHPQSKDQAHPHVEATTHGGCLATVGWSSGPRDGEKPGLASSPLVGTQFQFCIWKPISWWVTCAPDCGPGPLGASEGCESLHLTPGSLCLREHDIKQQIKTPSWGERPQEKMFYILFYVSCLLLFEQGAHSSPCTVLCRLCSWPW